MIRDHRLMGVKEGLWGYQAPKLHQLVSEIGQWVKALAAESDAQCQVLEPTKWKERADSCRLPSDL